MSGCSVEPDGLAGSLVVVMQTRCPRTGPLLINGHIDAASVNATPSRAHEVDRRYGAKAPERRAMRHGVILVPSIRWLTKELS
jgi:hypothetical protein